MLIISTLAVLLISVFPSADATCNVCQTNGAACINSTSFYMCYGSDIPSYDNLYHCKAGFDCTDLNAICTQSTAARPASCGDTSLCGLCSAHRNYLFACTSRTTFRLCYGAALPKSELGYCPDGYVCDASSDNVCVTQAEAEDVTCDVLNPIDDSPADTTPINDPIDMSTEQPVTAQEWCDAKQQIGVYQISGDTTCLEYIRCYIKGGVIYGSLAQCPTGTHFSGDSLQCVLVKPSYCV